MKKSNIIVLLDIDNTILDIERVKAYIADLIDINYGKGASEVFWRIYEEVRVEKKFIDSREIAMRFARVRRSGDFASAISAFQEIPFKQFLLVGASELIEFLASNTYLIIFSDGDQLFQKTKIQKLGLFEVADDVVISESKIDLLPEILKKYNDVTIIDDKPEILQKAKQVLSDCKTIWVRFGKYSNAKIDFKADFETSSLSEVKNYLQKSQ